MRNKFDEQLGQLYNEMRTMGNMIEKAIEDAIKALFDQDIQLARVVMNNDEYVDKEQKTIENICFQLLIQQQPVARDLRTITAAMKMVTDMERIGDQAADISELTVMMADSQHDINTERINQMANETIAMLLDAIDSYVERDMDKAHKVILHDDIVDDLFIQVKQDLIKVMQTKPEMSEAAADLLMVNKYLERIGDHATNIAEWVIFSLDDRLIDNRKD